MLWVSQASLACINQAAETYHVPAKLIIAVLNTERGKVGMAKKNPNGSHDFGEMQINSSWWPTLNRYGISQHDVQYNPCINIQVGTWILSKNIADGDDLLKSIGDYNSHTVSFNQRYSQLVRIHYTAINEYLKSKEPS